MHYIAKIKRTKDSIVLTNVFNEDTDEATPNRSLTKALRRSLLNIHSNAVVTFTSNSETGMVSTVKIVG